MRLSPFLVIIFAASTTFGISKSANAKISKSNTDIDSNKITIENQRKSSQDFQLVKSSETKLEPTINKQFAAHISHVENSRENTQELQLAKGIETKLEPTTNKQFAAHIPHVENQSKSSEELKLAKGVETKVEPTINKQFAAHIPHVENQSKSSEKLKLAKGIETKLEPTINKQFAADIPNSEIVENQSKISEELKLAKGVETKVEPTVNKQFPADIPNLEIIENSRENSQELQLAKGIETKLEPTINKQFAADIPNSEIVENSRENIQELQLAKSIETKVEPTVNKQFPADILNSEIIENSRENSEELKLAKGIETKVEPTINKQFSADISTSEIVENSRENIQELQLAKGIETKVEPTINKQFSADISTSEIVENQKKSSQELQLAKGVETKIEPTINKQFPADISNSEIVENSRESSQELQLAKGIETKLEPTINKQFAADIPNSEIVENSRENIQELQLAKGIETKIEPTINKQFASILSQEINGEITQNQHQLTSGPSDKLAQISYPEDKVPEEADIHTAPSAESKEFTLSQSQPTEPSTGEAEPLVLVAEVVVSGVDGELEDQVYQVISTQAGRTTTRSQLQRDINAIFATGFFRNVKALPEDTPLGVRVTFEVEPNPVLTSVTIEGSQVLPESEVDRIFGEQYGETLNLKIFEGGVEQVNQWYQDNGYVLGQVIGAPQVNDDGSVILEVAEGEIQDIQVRFINADGATTDEEGNLIEGRTREYIITREIQLQPGDIFERETAEKDIRRVFGLGIFEDVTLGLEPAPDDPNKANVIVNIVEKSTGSLAFGGGVSSASGLFGTVSYQQQNIGGNNQKLGGEFQVGERLLLADISFTDPWVGGDDHRLSYTVNAFRRRAISVIFDSDEDSDQRDVDLPNGDNPRVIRTGGGVSFTRPFIPNPFVEPEWTASLGLKYERVEIQDSDGDTEPRDELGNKLTIDDSGEDDLLTIQFGIVNDRRNNRRQPTSGSLLRFGTEQSIPIGSSEIALNRLRANYSFYIPVDFTSFVDGPQALAFNVQAGHIMGDLPPYEAFPLGGTNTVRGYDEGSLGAGRTFLLGTVEYRFPVFRFLGGALFIDAATVFDSQSSVVGNPGGVREKPGDGIGYGAGIRVQSPLGPIRVDYAINDEGDTRFHFGIGERF